jgi:KDO2-lipid IV(A) lauroyltransferase
MGNNKLFAAREGLETRAMRLIGGTMERASWDTCRRTGAWMGLVLFHALKQRKAVAVDNIGLAFPDISEAAARQMARRSAQNFAMTFCEFLHMRTASPESIRAYCDVQGLEHIERAREDGKGVIISTAHLGNWEIMGARAVQEFPLTVVARPTGNEGVEAHISAVRRAAGIDFISKYDTGRASLTVLRQNKALGILPDQHAGSDALLLPFFGHHTRMVSAVARLALLSGAHVAPCFAARRTPWLADGRIVAKAEPTWTMPRTSREGREQAIEEGTKRTIADLEAGIRAHPEQWMWMHRRWRDKDKIAYQKSLEENADAEDLQQ